MTQKLDNVTRIEEHPSRPREGETLYRHGVPYGAAGQREPRARDCPLTCICTCGRTIRLRSLDAGWEHVSW